MKALILSLLLLIGCSETPPVNLEVGKCYFGEFTPAVTLKVNARLGENLYQVETRSERSVFQVRSGMKFIPIICPSYL